MPGGVNSPVRAFKAVGGEPPIIAFGQGAHTTDVDGNEYIDYVGSWGPLILGHAHPAVVQVASDYNLPLPPGLNLAPYDSIIGMR